MADNTKEIKVRVLEEGIEELEAKLAQLEGKLKDVQEEGEKTDSTLDDVGKNGGAIAILDSFTGGLATRMRDAAEATKLFNFQLKISRAAIIATGIGAFAVALGVIVAYWDDIVDYIFDANDGLKEQEKINNRITRQLERQSQLRDDASRFIDLETQEKLSRARLAGASEAELTEIQRQGLENRINALDEAAKRADEILKQSTNAEQEVYNNAVKAQEEAYKALGEARVNYSQFLLEQQIADREAEIAAYREGDVKVKPLPTTGLTPLELEELQKVEFDLLNNAQIKRNFLEDKASKARIKLAEIEAQKRIELLSISADALVAWGDVIGQQTGAGKALAIASALINTYLGISNVWAEKSETGFVGAGLAQRIAATAVVLASGLNAVKQITSVQIPNAGISSRLPASPGAGAAPQIQPPDFNIVGNTGINQLADVIREQEDRPVRAYVTTGDIRTGEELDRTIRASATIG